MEIFLWYFSLFCFGALFWSFASVLISRWKNKESGIMMGRSFCPKCRHTLGALELIPIFSYIFQWWKCKHCSVKIPYRYPVLEFFMGITFVLMWYISYEIFFITFENIAFFWLIFLGFLTTVYIVYDILFMEIPDQIFIIWLVWIFILFILSFFIPPESVYFNYKYSNTFHTFVINSFFGAIILYSFLFLQIFISWSLYFARQKKYKDILELFLLYFTFPFIVIYDFICEKILQKKSAISENNEENIPLWVGPWDLFLAIIIGGTLGVTHGIAAFFLAYCIGAIISVGIILFSPKKSSTEIAFWPFLGLGFFLTVLFYDKINDFVNVYFSFFS